MYSIVQTSHPSTTCSVAQYTVHTCGQAVTQSFNFQVLTSNIQNICICQEKFSKIGNYEILKGLSAEGGGELVMNWNNL